MSVHNNSAGHFNYLILFGCALEALREKINYFIDVSLFYTDCGGSLFLS